jgi:caspase domain-containing protein
MPIRFHMIPLLCLFTVVCSSRNVFGQQLPLTSNRTDHGVALVIGNKDYQGRPLVTTLNDAEEIAQVLGRLGYDTVLKKNLKLSDIGPAITDLATRSAKAGTPVVFYYAGHGIQVNGVNYIVPVDADLSNALDIPRRTFSMDLLFDSLRALTKTPKIVILDACRNNPFAETSVNDWIPGLAATVNAPSNTLIAFSTDPGSIASDGVGRHSSYTRSLLRAIQSPGELVEDVFRKVRDDVRANSDGGQTPWENTSLVNQFYFWDPVYLTARITDGDDDVMLLVNGQETADWNNDGSTERTVRLRGGENTIAVKVFNQRSYTGGIPPLGHIPEGWRYSLEFKDQQGKSLLSLRGGEDRPQDNGPRHGKLFTVATLKIIVNTQSGNLIVSDVDPEHWKHPLLGDLSCTSSSHPFARGYCVVQQCPKGQWVRGTVSLSHDGTVLVSQGLETDLLDYGICGAVSFELLDKSGNTVAHGATPSRCIPAKAPGPARIADLPVDRVFLPLEHISTVTSIRVTVSCQADNYSPLGIGGRASDPGNAKIQIGPK